MGYLVKLYPKAYRDLDGIYQRAYDSTAGAGEATPWLECLEEGILGLGDVPSPSWKGKKEGILGGRYWESRVGLFRIIFKVSALERQVKIVTVQKGS